MQKMESTITFECPKCNNVNNVDVEVPGFVWDVDRMSDLYSEGNIDFVCPNQDCEEEFYGFARCHASGCEIVLDGSDKTYEGDFPMYGPELDGWMDYDIPEHPYGIFIQSCIDMDSLLKQNVSLDDQQLMQRMVLSQIISAMEAYLCDTLIQAVEANKDFMVNLCRKHKPLTNTSFGLLQIATIKQDINSFILDRVKSSLKYIIYHDIDKVSQLYEDTLGVKLIEKDADMAKLKAAIKNRHDCVHRNGFTKEDGVKNLSFTTEYVREVIHLIKEIIEKLEIKVAQETPL